MIGDIQRMIGQWSDLTFGPGTWPLKALIEHLSEEVNELREVYPKLGCEEESADIAILLFVFAHRAGIDLEAEVMRKHAINCMRKWKKPNEKGIIHHE